MIHKKPFIFLFLCLFFVRLPAQQDTWIESNAGIGDFSAGDNFEIAAIKKLQDGRVLAFVEGHSGGTDANGIYELNDTNWSWTRIGNTPDQNGFSSIIIDGNKIYDLRGGQIRAFDFTNETWEKILELPDIGFPNQASASIVNDVLYMRSRMENSNLTENQRRYPEEKFQNNEMFITAIDLNTKGVSFLRNRSNPLIIPSRGGNQNGSVVLQDGRAFLCQTFDYRDQDGYGGIYEWNGENWVSKSSGLDVLNLTRSGFGPIGPISTDDTKTRFFARTEQGLFEETEGGWLKQLDDAPARYFFTEKDIFQLQAKSWRVVFTDNALKQDYPAHGISCLSSIRHFMTPNEGQYLLGEVEVKTDAQGNCVDAQDAKKRKGIYRYIPNYNKEGTALNLHLENATYLGGTGDGKFTAETAITSNDELIVAGRFNDNMGVTPTNMLAADANSTGKLYVMNGWGTEVKRVIHMGDIIYDMDVDPTSGEIALLGDFGVAVLNTDYTLKWSQDETLTGDPLGDSFRARISIAADGKVVAVVKDGDENVIKLYDGSGETIHVNNKLQQEAKKVYDVEISSQHGQYYVCGFKQIKSNLQAAYLQSYPLTSSNNRINKCWGFESNEVSTSDNGADTRLYRIKAVDDGDVYVAGETAGGGPGGFSIFAYNGKDLSTQVAHEGNDFYTDGTQSGGAVHTAYVARVDPSSLTAEKGKFFYARKSDGETNTLRVKDGDLEIDNQGYMYLVGTASARYDKRGIFNVNGQLIERYTGGESYVLMTTPSFNTRVLWGSLNKQNRGGGADYNRIAVGQGKVAFLANANRGEMFTTENALKKEPYNIVRIDGETDTLSAPDVHIATWQREVWETANNDIRELAYFPSDTCIRADDFPCPVIPEEGQSLIDLVNPFNMITPNNDGRNDEWRIDNLQILNAYEIRVFSSTGQEVFSSRDYRRNIWDGTRNGQMLPEGVYYYTIKAEGISKVKTGYITLIR